MTDKLKSDPKEYHSLAEDKRPKFLVSWVEGDNQGPGMTRGQTCLTSEDATRLMAHLQTLETTLYCENRRIGSKLGSYSRKVFAS